MIAEKSIFSQTGFKYFNWLYSFYEVATKVTATGKNTTHKEKKNKDGSTAKKKAIKKKITAVATDPAMVQVYGLIEHIEKLTGNITQERAQRVANRTLNSLSQMQRELSFTCPALPSIWVGGKVHLNIPSYGLKGNFAVTATEYSVTGTDGPKMTLTIDAGSVSLISEALGESRIIAVKRIQLWPKPHAGQHAKKVIVHYADGAEVVHEHKPLWRVKSAVRVKLSDVPEYAQAKKGETVLIKYTNGKHYTVPNRVIYGKGLVAITDEGYIPAVQL